MKKIGVLCIFLLLILCSACSAVEERTDIPADLPEESSAQAEPAAEPEAESPTPDPVLPEGTAAVHFIDVGQGDCTLIDMGETEILIDSGRQDHIREVIAYISDLVDDELDVVIATHPDSDHIGGMVEILKTFSVGTLIDSGAIKDSETYYHYIEAVEEYPPAAFLEDKDMAYSLGPGASLEIIETGDGNIDVNEDSVVSVFRFGEVSVMLTGDMGTVTEEANLDKFPKVTVLKAGHHGSAGSTGSRFLQRVRPEYVIISAGADNEYGHPAPETLQRINEIGAISYTTIDQGTIVLNTDGKTLSFDMKGTQRVQEPADSATYSTGDSGEAPPGEGGSVSAVAGAAAAEAVTAEAATTEQTDPEVKYIGNMNTHKFHYPWCKSVSQMKEKNKKNLYSRDEAIRLGFEPCQNCKP